MGITATVAAPRGCNGSTWWVEREADAELARDRAYTDIVTRLERGEIALWQAVSRLRLAYWKAHRDLYDWTDEDRNK